MRLIRSRAVHLAPLLAACALASGCASPKYTTTAPPESADQTLSEGYALLHTLVAQNRRVGQIFMIKGGPAPFRELIQEIARASNEAARALESFAEQDDLLSLEGANLPAIEADARAAVENTVSGELLGATGAEFQRRLTIEQIKATRYASHLAKVIEAIEPDGERAAFLRELDAQFEAFHARLQATLTAVPDDSSS